MLIILYGANRFARSEYLSQFLMSQKSEPEYIEGESFDIGSLASLTQGQSLFQEERLVIIDNLSENSEAWSSLSEWLDGIELENTIIILEDKLDKRKTATRKLMKIATVKEFTSLKDGDSRAASTWMIGWAKEKDIIISQSVAGEIIRRVGYDQGMLANEVERLSVIHEELSLETVQKYTPDRLEAKVFSILESALKGNSKRLMLDLTNVRQLSDPYQFMGLLSSQIFQFAAINQSGVSIGEISSELKLNSYALQNTYRVGASSSRVGRAIPLLAEADFNMKSTSKDPWDIIELALVDVSLK